MWRMLTANRLNQVNWLRMLEIGPFIKNIACLINFVLRHQESLTLWTKLSADKCDQFKNQSNFHNKTASLFDRVIFFLKHLNLNFIVSLRNICSEYHRRICELEDAKFDLEYSVAKKDLEARTFTMLFYFSLVTLSMSRCSRYMPMPSSLLGWA